MFDNGSFLRRRKRFKRPTSTTATAAHQLQSNVDCSTADSIFNLHRGLQADNDILFHRAATAARHAAMFPASRSASFLPAPTGLGCYYPGLPGTSISPPYQVSPQSPSAGAKLGKGALTAGTLLCQSSQGTASQAIAAQALEHGGLGTGFQSSWPPQNDASSVKFVSNATQQHRQMQQQRATLQTAAYFQQLQQAASAFSLANAPTAAATAAAKAPTRIRSSVVAEFKI